MDEAQDAKPQEPEQPKSERIFGVLGDKKIVIDPEWARPQEDLDAWLAGDV
jgi:hypothetical protein